LLGKVINDNSTKFESSKSTFVYFTNKKLSATSLKNLLQLIILFFKFKNNPNKWLYSNPTPFICHSKCEQFGKPLYNCRVTPLRFRGGNSRQRPSNNELREDFERNKRF